jgi:pilus assembly protein CpaD
MMPYRTAFAAALSLALGGCNLVADYSAAEASKKLSVATSTTQVDVRFVPGSAALATADAARLRYLAASGAIGAADRVTVSAAGGPELAKQRMGAIAAQLLHYGIVVTSAPLAQVPNNQAIVEVARSLVTLPPCPNWSKYPAGDFNNAASSNFGCASQTNLGLMAANPGDLASGRPLEPALGQPAVSAVTRYLTDKVVLPTANTALPIAQTTSTQTPGGSQ